LRALDPLLTRFLSSFQNYSEHFRECSGLRLPRSDMLLANREVSDVLEAKR